MTTMNQYHELPLTSTVYGFSSTFDGEYRGWVTDRKDPLGIGRIKVHIPELQPPKEAKKDAIYDMKDLWIMPEFPTHGIKDVPWNNQWVRVKFRNGNADRPYYCGSIIHEDEPLFEMNESMGDGIQPPNNLNESLKGEGRPVNKGKDKRVSNHEKRKDNLKLHFVKADDRLKEIPVNLREICADSHVMARTPRQAHYHVYQDHPDLNFIEKRTGNRKTFVMHDKLNYTLIRDKDQFSFIMHHGENNEDNYIELRTKDNNILMLDQENRTVFLRSHYGGALIFEDDTTTVYLGTKKDWTWDLGKTTKLVKHGPNRKYDAWYSDKSRPSTKFGDVLLGTVQNFSYAGGLSFSDNIKLSQINRERAHIALCGNTGFIYMQDYIA